MFKTTIDSLLSDVKTKIAKLKDLAEKHHIDSVYHSELRVEHQRLSEGFRGERDRAVRIAEKFEDLLK